MEQGAYIITELPESRDILFNPIATFPITESQQKFTDEIHRTLSVLRIIFPDDNQRFKNYFANLVGLCQFAVVGPAAQPEFGYLALMTFQADVVAQEAGRVKNGYMIKLGKWSGVFALVVTTLGLALVKSDNIALDLSPFLYLWAGCMAGVWLSFGIRKTVLNFKDLAIMEEDRMEPQVRLIFAGLITLTFGLVFHTKLMTIEVGDLKTDQMFQDLHVSILIGVLLGISEKLLPAAINEHAAKFFKS